MRMPTRARRFDACSVEPPSRHGSPAPARCWPRGARSDASFGDRSAGLVTLGRSEHRRRPTSRISPGAPARGARVDQLDSASARASRATRRASCTGTGVRDASVDARSTVDAAVSGSVRQPACARTGRAPVRVQTQYPTVRPPTWAGPRDARTGSGRSPVATRLRCVTPTVGSPRTAPRWTASPAPLGWSRPVASTSSTSGRTSRAVTAPLNIGPWRSARSPGSYGPPASPVATTWASTSAARRGVRPDRAPRRASSDRRHGMSRRVGTAPGCQTTADAHARSRCDGRRAGAKTTKHPPTRMSSPGVHAPEASASTARRESSVCRRRSSSAELGHGSFSHECSELVPDRT